MKTFKTCLAFTTALVLGLLAITGCESTDGGGSVSGGVYYGSGFHDPWYYGGYYNDPDIIVTPPPGRPTHPVARPLPAPTPSIPHSPRPMPRPVGWR